MTGTMMIAASTARGKWYNSGVAHSKQATTQAQANSVDQPLFAPTYRFSAERENDPPVQSETERDSATASLSHSSFQTFPLCPGMRSHVGFTSRPCNAARSCSHKS